MPPPKYNTPDVPNTMAAEKARVVSAHLTTRVLRNWGSQLGMWAGCGFPKSGTVWLCQLLAGYLDLPYAQNPHLPVAMASVIHGHWDYDPKFPPTVYIVRDGRDVLVSKYFHFVRQMDGHRNPRAAKRMRSYFDEILGPGWEPDAIERNLPRFVQRELTDPLWEHTPWGSHVKQWTSAPSDKVGVVTYENMILDPVSELSGALAPLLNAEVDHEYLALTVDRFSFERQTGRKPGTEDSTAFVRKGIAGDWRNFFDDKSSAIFMREAGEQLVALGYATE